MPEIRAAEIVNRMRLENQEKIDSENVIHDKFNKLYLDWKAFSNPVIRDLESKKPRCRSDEGFSRLWERGLKLQARLVHTAKEFDDAKAAHKKQCGIKADGMLEDGLEETDCISGSTLPEAVK